MNIPRIIPPARLTPARLAWLMAYETAFQGFAAALHTAAFPLRARSRQDGG